MRKSWGVLPILFIFTLLLVSLPLQAAQTGKIAGVITDAETGEALPGASVQIDGTMMGAATDQNGQFFILNVPPGTYTCNVMFMGYTTQKINNVKVQIDVTTRLDAKLSATVIEGESVSVVAERPIVDKTMTASKVSFGDDVINNVMPANSLNEILESSVMTQSMRGGNKTGVAYMVDGVDVSDIMYKTGGGTDAYTSVKRGGIRTSSSTGTFEEATGARTSETSAGMVSTVGGGIAQSSVAQAEVIAGTFSAEYSASSGVINIASKSGGRKYTGKLNMRSSLGGLDHMGPDVYYNNTAGDPNIFGGQSAADLYIAQRDLYAASGDDKKMGLAELMTWDGPVDYGDSPRINGEVTFGGPLSDKGAFFFVGTLYNDHGTLPGEFARNLTGALKLNYSLGDNDNLTVYGKLDDGGKLGGWNNRNFSYFYMFDLGLQAINQSLSYVSYAKWNHIFDAASYLDLTVSYVGADRTWGYKPNADGKIAYDDYGDDWLILDTVEKADFYMLDTETRIVNQQPGNDPDYYVEGFDNQTRFGITGYHYEDLQTSTLTGNINYTRQVNFHHQLKTGAEFKYNTIDMFQHKSGVTGSDLRFPFETTVYNVNPYGFGTYLQDKIEYEGIIVNIGLRFDGYNTNTAGIANLWEPVQADTQANGQNLYSWATDDDSKSKLRTYFSPRIGVSHPITETAAMHYSWGIYTTQPNFGNWLFSYGGFANMSLPNAYNPDPEPERATAYEIGINLALSDDYGADLTAYYRDTRNASVLNFAIAPDKSYEGGSGIATYNYYTNWGYRDSRGLELTLWKRPQREMYWDIVGVSGNISMSYSYNKGSANGAGINQEAAFDRSLSTKETDFDFDLGYIWPTYSRGYNDVNAKGTLLLDFPLEIKLTNVLTYRSPWRFTKTLDVQSARYEEKIDGDSFFQWDMRLTKYFTVGKIRAGAFVEMLNVLDRENVLSYDKHPIGNTNYEEGKGPYGSFGRPTDQYGNLFSGIAREMYAGFEIAFE